MDWERGWACVAADITLDCAEVVRAGDLDCARLLSTQGDSSTALVGSLKMGRLVESPVYLSIFSGEWPKRGP